MATSATRSRTRSWPIASHRPTASRGSCSTAIRGRCSRSRTSTRTCPPGQPIDRVISLTADEDEVVARLLKRAEIEGRADDNEATIRTRQQVYAEQTAPLLDVYGQRGLVVEVDGLGSIDEVSSRIFAALDAV